MTKKGQIYKVQVEDTEQTSPPHVLSVSRVELHFLWNMI